MELNLVANYFGMQILKPGMIGPRVNDMTEVLEAFAKQEIPEGGVVDYVLGSELSSGIFLIAEHKSPQQKKYLRYLGLGDGPRYLLFEPYHFCHLEAAITIAKVVILGQETINNGLNPTTKTVTMAKFDLKKGQVLDGIGGDLVYGDIYSAEDTKDLLPMGLSEGAVLNCDIVQNQPISFTDVALPDNSATKLLLS